MNDRNDFLGYIIDVNKDIKNLLSEINLFISPDDSPAIDLEAARKFSRTDKVFKVVSEVLNPDSVLEFGTWLGASATAWALHTHSECPIVCVDTWLGSWEHLSNLNSGKDWGRHNLKIQRGRPDFFGDFLSNIDQMGLQSRIFPISATTQGATKFFESRGIRFPLIYIDAAHDYNPVWQDIAFAKSLLARNGIILGDDYETWQSVTAAVNDYCDSEDLILFYGENSWLILDFLENEIRSVLESKLIDLGFQKRIPKTPKALSGNDLLILRERLQVLEKSNDSLNLQLRFIRSSVAYRFNLRVRPILRLFKR